MVDSRTVGLQGRRLLIVEDEYVIADDLAQSFQELGAEVVGPVATLAEALETVAREGDSIDGAVLDITLGHEHAYPVADALIARGVPFVFATGYDAAVIPEAYAHVPRCEKPVNWEQLAQFLHQASRAGRSAPVVGEGA